MERKNIHVVKTTNNKTVKEEFREMKVGDVKAFPLSQYTNSYIKTVPFGPCLNETLDGWKWKTHVDRIRRATIVERIK